jgi:hypothetical protein
LYGEQCIDAQMASTHRSLGLSLSPEGDASD